MKVLAYYDELLESNIMLFAAEQWIAVQRETKSGIHLAFLEVSAGPFNFTSFSLS